METRAAAGPTEFVRTVAVPPDSAQARRDGGVAAMNRGFALLQAGQLPAAVAAYDEAVALLRAAAPAGPADWTVSLAAALMNRGQLLHRASGLAAADQARAAFDEAVALLEPRLPGDSPWIRRNLAGTLLNRATLALDLADPARARADAGAALTLAAPQARADRVDAELALKSARALGGALGRLLAAPDADAESLAAELSDVVDDALALVRHWRDRGELAFAPIEVRLFRLGAQLYRLHQPHFLAEFIREHPVGADETLRGIALEQVEAALRAPPRAGFLVAGDPASERQLAVWRELAALREQLARLSSTP
ncbi:MAG: hypothetical protein JNG83_09945 [Opitutaceae bacterium]|nr:hypothetical protein [Opitutaceae bacterium]